MLYIEQFVHANKMRNAHPGERFAFTLITMIISVATTQTLVHLAIIAIMLGFLTLKAKIPIHVILKIYTVPATFLLLGVATIALQVGRTNEGMLLAASFGNIYLGVTQASVYTASQTFFNSLSAVSCLYFLILTTPMTEIMHILKLLKVPSLLLDLMIIIYRFIFVFAETAFHIYTAQSSRWGYAGFRRAMRSFGLLFANLWAKSFAKSQAIFISLQSRGYEGEFNMLTPIYHWSAANLLLFGFIDICLILVVLYGRFGS